MALVAYPHVTGLAYRPSGAATANQTGALFLPAGKRPSDGWPVLMHTDFGGWLLSNTAATFSKTGTGNLVGSGLQNDGLPWLCLQNGIAVYSHKLTPTDFGATVSVAGRGLFKSQSTQQFFTQDFAEKDYCCAVQKVRSVAATYGLNPDLVFGKGLSSGGSAALFSAYSQNYAGQSGFHAGHSTRLNGVIVHNTQYLYRAIAPGNSSYYHFPSTASMDPYSAITDIASSIFDSKTGWLDDASVLKYGFETDTVNSPWTVANIVDLNKSQRLYMVATIAPFYTGLGSDPYLNNPAFRTTADLVWNNCAGYTNYTGAVGANAGIYTSDGYHQGHGAYLMKQALQANGVAFASSGPLCRLVTTHEASKIAGVWDANDPSHDKLYNNVTDFSADGEMAQDQLAWLQALVRSL